MAKNNDIDIIDNEIDTIPRSTSGTGTISSVNNKQILGSGTSFTTELTEGDWIFISAQDEVHRVNNIVSDTELYLDSAFTTPLSGASFAYVGKNQYTMISWAIDATGTAVIDGQTLPAEYSGAVGASTTNSGGRTFVDPIVVDTTPNGNKVYIQVSN